MPTIKLTGLSGGRVKTIGTNDDAIVDGSMTIGDADTDSPPADVWGDKPAEG